MKPRVCTNRRLLWVQLGVPDPDQAYADSNQPVAAGYVLDWCLERGALPGIDWEILDAGAATRAGDAALLAAVLERSPDVLCLSCAMWNVERSLWLARQVKTRRPGVRVIAGGPEITAGSPWLADGAVDVFVRGEGETGLPLALAALERSGAGPVVLDAPPLASLEGARDPYSAGILRPGPAGNCLVEVTRGCPYRCHYCFYSKNAAMVRRHSGDSLARFFRWAGPAGITDVYLLDPTFNVPRRLDERLAELAGWNPAAIPLHTETRLEGIHAERAGAFARAGFASVEAGLQSIHRDVCAGIGRRLDRPAFAQGAAALRDAGVTVEAGIILGLPGDGLPGFHRTLRWLEQRGLGDEAAVFLLSLLPGTSLRDRAETEGWAFQDRPPYFLRTGGGWDEAALLQGVYATEDVLARSHYLDLAPYGDGAEPYLDRLALAAGGPDPAVALDRVAKRLAWAVTLDVRLAGREGGLTRLVEAGAAYRRHCPFGLVRLVLHSPAPAPPETLRALRTAFRGEPHYWTRMQHYRDDPVREFSVRLFQRVPPGEWHRWLAGAPEELDLVFELPADPVEFDHLAEAVYAHPRPGRAWLAGGGGVTGAYRDRVAEEVETNRTFLRWHPDD